LPLALLEENLFPGGIVWPEPLSDGFNDVPFGRRVQLLDHVLCRAERSEQLSFQPFAVRLPVGMKARGSLGNSVGGF
jgi:hypothetical protein